MQGGQTFEVDLQTRAERRIKGVARTPERVTAGLGAGEQLQRGGARGLELVRNVRVPEIDAGERVGTRGRGTVYDCLGKKSSSDLGVSWVGNEPWTSSKPGSFGTGVVACLWRGPQ